MHVDLSTAIARAIAALEQLAPARARTASIQDLYETQRRLIASAGRIPHDLAATLRATIEQIDEDAPAEACALRHSLADETEETSA